MMEIFKNIDWVFFAEIFIFMFGAFLIGYFFAKKSFKKPVAIRKKEIDINDIETIFSEIKPDIIKMIEKHKDKKTDANAASDVPKKMKLNFDNIGYSDAFNKDDLTKIEGLSPFIEDKLNKLGIYSYDQISRFTKDDVETITHLIEYFPGRIERDNWVGQAKALQKKKATHVE